MSISEKLITIANNEQKVYHSGQLNIISNSKHLQGKESGTIVSVNDVTPIEHNVGVKVASKNLFDKSITDVGTFTEFNNVPREWEYDKWYRGFVLAGYCHKDYIASYTINEDGISFIGNSTYYTYGMARAFPCMPNSQYTLSYSVSNGDPNRQIGVSYYDATGQLLKSNYGTNIMTPANCTTLVITLMYTSANNDPVVYSNIQLELGTTATPYTPYVADFTGVEVARYGKNLFDSNAFVNVADNSIYYGINENGEIYVKQSDYRDDKEIPACIILNAGIYTISSTNELKAKIKLINVTDKTIIAYNLNNTFTLTKTTEIGIKSWFEANTVLGSVQIEYGTNKSKYEPYKEPITYTANADGTVEGVKSISPNMTLIPNNNAVTVVCEYLRDIDLYIDNLITGIALTGGN